jgi:hypothetical protein
MYYKRTKDANGGQKKDGQARPFSLQPDQQL